MSSHFYRDLDRLNQTLLDLNAVRVTADGFEYVDTELVPESLLRVYRLTLLYGFANGLLPRSAA